MKPSSLIVLAGAVMTVIVGEWALGMNFNPSPVSLLGWITVMEVLLGSVMVAALDSTNKHGYAFAAAISVFLTLFAQAISLRAVLYAAILAAASFVAILATYKIRQTIRKRRRFEYMIDAAPIRGWRD